MIFQMTGRPGAGKTTLAQMVREYLRSQGVAVEIIDGDDFRRSSAEDLGFSREDRVENLRRMAKAASALESQREGDGVVLIAAVNPYEESRRSCGEICGAPLIYIRCSLETAKERDPKGLYARAALPVDDPNRIEHFTGIDDPFEEPGQAALIIDTEAGDPHQSTRALAEFIMASRRRALFIGRFQPFHNGHKYLIDDALQREGKPVVVLVRERPLSIQDPIPTGEVVAMIRKIYEGNPVWVGQIPDIESIRYGRGVGYSVDEQAVPDGMKGISASRIRAMLRAGESEHWRRHVPEAIHQDVERAIPRDREKSGRR